MLISCSAAMEKEVVVKTIDRNPDLLAEYIKVGDIQKADKYISSFEKIDFNYECFKSIEKKNCLDLAIINKRPAMIDFIFETFGEEKAKQYLNKASILALATRDANTIDSIFKRKLNYYEPLEKVVMDGDLELLNLIIKYYDNNFSEIATLLDVANEEMTKVLTNKFYDSNLSHWVRGMDFNQQMDLNNDGVKENVKIFPKKDPIMTFDNDFAELEEVGEVVIEIEYSKKLYKKSFEDSGNTSIYLEDLNKDGLLEIIYSTGYRTYFNFDVFHYTDDKLERIGSDIGSVVRIEDGKLQLDFPEKVVTYDELVNNFVLTDENDSYLDPDVELVPLEELSNFLSKTTGDKILFKSNTTMDEFNKELAAYQYDVNDNINLSALINKDDGSIYGITFIGYWLKKSSNNDLNTWHKYCELIIDYFEDGENFNSVIDQITNGEGSHRTAIVNNKKYTITLEPSITYGLTILMNK
jgi:hypothetical protein